MLRNSVAVLSLFLLVTGFTPASGHNPDETAPFTLEKVLPHTSVKSQGQTGTCWSFCTISLIEAELLRMGKGEWDLSEMFVVYHCYPKKAELYLRTGGGNTFGEGGIDNDVFWVIKNYGLLPQHQYPGSRVDPDWVSHRELEEELYEYLNAVIDSRQPVEDWDRLIRKRLNREMGAPAASITIDGTTMTPQQFATGYLGIRPEDYAGITSFLHLPMEGQVEHYLPDNWLHHDDFYNVTLDQFMEIIDTALERGHTISIGADTTEKSYDGSRGIAEWFETETITPEERQRMWDNRSTQDDHGMHIVGYGSNPAGKRYYYVKNSYGPDSGPYGGYVFMSRNYIRAKVNSITVHVDALDPAVRRQLMP